MSDTKLKQLPPLRSDEEVKAEAPEYPVQAFQVPPGLLRVCQVTAVRSPSN